MSKYENKCAKQGFVNASKQLVVGLGDQYISNHEHGEAWVLRCLECSYEYGANGCDVHIRKCPKCQGGQPSLLKLNEQEDI